MTDNIRPLADIVEDLWGVSPFPAQPAAADVPAYRSTFPAFEHLWKTADDTVDWTDALAYDKPRDGLTSAHLWGFFHQHAEKVLQGDLGAYVEVLKAANPLGDLAAYAVSFDVDAESADRLKVRFEAHPAYLDKEEDEVQRYLCAVSLRVARDLMALLPVQQVRVEAMREGTLLMDVCFERNELQKVKFSFIDPVQFVTSCRESE